MVVSSGGLVRSTLHRNVQLHRPPCPCMYHAGRSRVSIRAACREELQKPLLQNGHDSTGKGGDEEDHAHLDLPPHLSHRASEGGETISSSAQSSDEDGSQHPPPQKSALQRLLDSPTLATSCCVFLCFILKVVQQVGSLSQDELRLRWETLCEVL